MRKPLFFLLGLLCHLAQGQLTGQASSAAILADLENLANTQRVLYLAAHPDDENTRFIAWLENHRHIRTAYLSLTRGDGGQNLIGPELGAALGVLRTQELMQARELDRGEQYFSRAVDFGYSKTAEETLDFWDERKILADVVWVIRQFKPDAIVTRFPPDARGGHGHHTASAILGLQAIALAASDTAFAQQLDLTEPWSCPRLFWNHSSWWEPKLDSIAAADPDYLELEVGDYNPNLGLSCNEIASLSRTQHKSQGFGVSIARGKQTEYLKRLYGERAEKDLLDGIPAGWARYGWSEGDLLLQDLLARYDPQNPGASLPALQAFWEGAKKQDLPREGEYLRRQVGQIMGKMLGLEAELRSPDARAVPGQMLNLRLRLLVRQPIPVQLEKVQIGGEELAYQEQLPLNTWWEDTLPAPPLEKISQPYWLEKSYGNSFAVEEQHLIGLPENPPALKATAFLKIGGDIFPMAVPVRHLETDRVEGEVNRPLLVYPNFTLQPDKHNLIFVDEAPQTVQLRVKTHQIEPLRLAANAEGWAVEPQQVDLEFHGGRDATIEFTVRPLKNAPPAAVLRFSNLLSASDKRRELLEVTELNYDHIDPRVLFEPAQVQLTKLDLHKRGEKVGYIVGAGDRVPEALRQMGYQVDLLDAEALRQGDLSQYQAILAGIRAYNTQAWLPEVQAQLMAYVAAGGNYIVQYNTRSRDLLSESLGPYPFSLSRERVTEEDAPVTFALPEHPLLNTPNRLDRDDFDHWVQERGLYFAGEWDERYQAPLSWHDRNEPPRQGALLFARHGKGAFMYSGISFFRQLPAGVPGAYRLLANMISFQSPVE